VIQLFERFTDTARRVVVYAKEGALLLDHDHIGTEHILLGLSHDDTDTAVQILEEAGVDLPSARAAVEESVGRGAQAPVGEIMFTPRAKKVLELSLREALQLGHNYIGTEHILLGLLREGEGGGAQVLKRHGVELDEMRRRILTELRAGQRTASSVFATHGRGLGPIEARLAAIEERLERIENLLRNSGRDSA
jgi:ATP-dependent Clp protease ATP-binding subunit ClpC